MDEQRSADLDKMEKLLKNYQTLKDNNFHLQEQLKESRELSTQVNDELSKIELKYIWLQMKHDRLNEAFGMERKKREALATELKQVKGWKNQDKDEKKFTVLENDVLKNKADNVSIKNRQFDHPANGLVQCRACDGTGLNYKSRTAMNCNQRQTDVNDTAHNKKCNLCSNLGRVSKDGSKRSISCFKCCDANNAVSIAVQTDDITVDDLDFDTSLQEVIRNLETSLHNLSMTTDVKTETI